MHDVINYTQMIKQLNYVAEYKEYSAKAVASNLKVIATQVILMDGK